MHPDLSLKEMKKEWHGSLKAYVIGFVASVLLTAASFLLVISQLLSGYAIIFALIGLAIVQAGVQLLFFLHVGQEAKPRWETLVFWFMVVVLLIIALGSLWIMYDLNSRMMSGMYMEKG